MSLSVVIKPAAQVDIDEAFIWYEKTLDNLGFEFLLSLDAVIESIRRNPEYASFSHSNVRSAALTRFPFAVYYIMEENRIVVLAVLHHSRNPQQWRKRI